MTQELNLAHLLQTLSRRWLLIALVLFVTVGATLLYGLLRPPTYQARAVLRVRSRPWLMGEPLTMRCTATPQES